MDDLRQTTLRRDVPGLHREPSTIGPSVPSDFVPMRLVMQPSGMTVELTRPDMMLGRHSTADLRLPLPDVSRRHCRFVFEQGAWQIIDMESLNGICVNGLRVQQATIHDQDLIGIGGFQFKVVVGPLPRVAALPSEQSKQTPEAIQSVARTLPGPHRNNEPTQRKAS